MARLIGRNIAVAVGSGSPLTYTTIATVRSKNAQLAREPIDLTNDDDLGKRILAAATGQEQIDITASGVAADDHSLLALGFDNAGTALEDVRLTIGSGGPTVTGKFFISGLNITGEYNGAATFEATFQSAADWTYAAT